MTEEKFNFNTMAMEDLRHETKDWQTYGGNWKENRFVVLLELALDKIDAVRESQRKLQAENRNLKAQLDIQRRIPR